MEPKISRRSFIGMASAAVSSAALTGCASLGSDSSSNPSDSTGMVTLTALADATPHAEILKHATDALAEVGLKVEIKSEDFDDTWMEQVQNGSIDFMYDAYVPYLDEWNSANGGDLVAATLSDGENGGIHLEPLVMMSEKYETLDDVPDNATVAIKDDVTNEYRCLKLLEQAGWVSLSSDLTLSNASTAMIRAYNKPLQIIEMDADVIMHDRQDFDTYVTNTNRLLDAGLDPTHYLVREGGKDAKFANVIAIKKERNSEDAFKKLVLTLQSDEMRDWINSNYKGAVIAAF